MSTTVASKSILPVVCPANESVKVPPAGEPPSEITCRSGVPATGDCVTFEPTSPPVKFVALVASIESVAFLLACVPVNSTIQGPPSDPVTVHVSRFESASSAVSSVAAEAL